MHCVRIGPLKAKLLPLCLAVCLTAVAGLGASVDRAGAQTVEPVQDASVIRTQSDADTDAAIAQRLRRIFGELDTLAAVQVRVAEGVVTLDGALPEPADLERAEAIAGRVEGVVAVRNDIEASVDVGERVSPFLQKLTALFRSAVSSGPLLLLGVVVLAACSVLGWWVASFSRFWRRLTPNPFVGELLAQAVRVVSVVLGMLLALNLVGATALMGTVLGGAGVIGLAIGFAVRDTLENYISSIMLSLRQPFRANDHVVIDGHEGKVVRLTSRATVLMTLDGNHLRIPNLIVFKAVILNYTRNPERRLEFDLGVDASDDPESAICTGVAALAALDFILAEPAPAGLIVTVGDSNIVLKFLAWIDQDDADFLKARSAAIRAAKIAVEAAGFTLPEPIYRLRIDQFPELMQAGGRPAPKAADRVSAPPPPPPPPARAEGTEPALSVRPDAHIEKTIAAERRTTGEEDLLSDARPIE
jgi:small conductance mechanosensitive channel